jgi:hypothetical protein
MEYKLTRKRQLNKRDKDNKSRSYLIYFLNGVKILKQKLPYEDDLGYQYHPEIENEYLLNGRIYQTRTKFGKTRNVSFPISKNKLHGLPNDFKVELSTINDSCEDSEANKRFILDIRCGCAAIRDTKHPKYSKDYQGLHRDTCDVVEYCHGFQNSEKGCWEMEDEDIKFLTAYCSILNKLSDGNS